MKPRESIRLRYRTTAIVRAGTLLLVLAPIVFANPRDVEAQMWGSADGADIGLLLWMEDHRLLNDTLRARLVSTVQHAFIQALGPTVRLELVASVDGQSWLSHHDLGELTPELCTSFGLDRQDEQSVRRWQKTLVARLTWQRGTYKLAVCEYDDTFYQVGRVHRADVIQREVVPITAARLGLRCWTAIGRIQSVAGETVDVTFPIQSNSPWIQHPQSGDVLQLCQQLRLRDGTRVAVSHDQYLLVDQAAAVTTAHLMKAPQISNWLGRFGRENVRFLARRLDVRRQPVTVEVRLESKNQPREGCEVYVSATPPSSLTNPGKRIGLTNSQGQLTFSHESDALFFVSVRFNDLVDTRVYAHGADSDPLTFLMPDRQKQLAYDLELKRLRDDLKLRRHRVQHLANEMKQAGDNVDVAAARQTVSQAQQHFDVEELRRRVRTLRILAAKDNVTIDEDVNDFLQALDRFEEDPANPYFDKALHTTRIVEVKQRLVRAMSNLDWDLTGRLLEELCQLEPNDADAQSKLAAFRTARSAKSAEHANARAVMDGARQVRNIDSLLARWDDIRDAMETMLQHQDRLMLAKVHAVFDQWFQVIRDEVLTIKNVSSTPVTPDKKAALERRLVELQTVSRELVSINTRCNQLLSGGVLP